MFLAATFGISAAALAVEAVAGYPSALFRRIGHPVTWIGALIGATETRLNRETAGPGLQKCLGLASLLFWLALVGVLTSVLTFVCGGTWAGRAVLVLLATSLLAQRALYDHVAAVAAALEREGLPAARHAVGQIVGRATEALDEAAVARAAIESLAENFSDGVVAPAFWLALGGLPGGALYKTINTADSMVGHRTRRFMNFGWASARLDDLVNLIPARLSALFIVLAAALDKDTSMRQALRMAWRDARQHLSPNAGWPEAAMAGALDLKLGGPRIYGAQQVEGAFLGDGRRDATAKDIRRALALFRRAAILEFCLYAALALLMWQG